MSQSRKKDALKPQEHLPKPNNIFYIWYAELCRRANLQPLNCVKPPKPKNDTILDFQADRIKPEEWTPILNALRLDTSLHVITIRSRAQCKFLFDVDSEEKVRHMKRRAGSIFTAYILRVLVKSLSNCVKRNDVLSCLELDGVPATIEYIDCLFEALKKNKTIKILAIKYCSLRDLGCQVLCDTLKYIPNIQVLNLTACGLGPLSAQYIAKVVKYQQINRYCESWHNSLRYEDPDVGIMAGLKRITLNNNPNIGDEGLIYILDELDDDLWIKAIDMQRCGITENVAGRLLDVVEYSKSLEVADFRANDNLVPSTIEKILDILRSKQKFGYETEYQWCMTATTLPTEGSVQDTASMASTKIPLKSKSVPLKNITSNVTLRRMKTCISINKPQCGTSKNLTDAKKDVLKLNDELQKEISKRLQSEMENKKLRQELEKIKSTCTLNDLNHKEKVVKFNPIPPKVKISKSKSARSIKPAKQNKVDFLFENTQPANILQKLIQQSDAESETKDYFKDIINKSEDNCDSDSGSNDSLIKFMKEVKGNGEGDKNRNVWEGSENNQYIRKILAH